MAHELAQLQDGELGVPLCARDRGAGVRVLYRGVEQVLILHRAEGDLGLPELEFQFGSLRGKLRRFEPLKLDLREIEGLLDVRGDLRAELLFLDSVLLALDGVRLELVGGCPGVEDWVAKASPRGSPVPPCPFPAIGR